jgi:hypothetical protein
MDALMYTIANNAKLYTTAGGDQFAFVEGYF